MNKKMMKYIETIADHHIEVYWAAFEDYTDQNFELFLSLFNFNGEWDIVGSDSRIHAGIEELLEVIEPKEVFERLHGEKNLKSYHSLHEVIKKF
jgi:hypothetical protein